MLRLLITIVVILPFVVFSQAKKFLDHGAYDQWRSISKSAISNDGKLVNYSTKTNGYGNSQIALHKLKGPEEGRVEFSYKRAANPSFSNDSKYLIFEIAPDFHSLRDLKRKKIKEKDLPKDSLGIYEIDSETLKKVPGLKSFAIPEKWDNYLVYLYDPILDSTQKKEKKRSKKNGYHLVVRDLLTNKEVILPYVLDFSLAEEGASIAAVTTGNDSTIAPGIYKFDFELQSFKPIFRSKGEYFQLAWDKTGSQLSFISDMDTTKALVRDYRLHYHKTGSDSSITVARNSSFENLTVSTDFKSYFSESGKRLYFQSKEFPVLQDTALLKEEIVNVEVWNSEDQRLFTDQENDLQDDKKFGYLAYYDTKAGKIVTLGGKAYSNVRVSDQGDGANGVALNNYPYRKQLSWKGYTLQDVYALSLTSGKTELIAEEVRGNIQLSPKGKFAFWYNQLDSAWFTYEFAEKKIRQVTSSGVSTFYNEIHDTPSEPWPYGMMSWTENDSKMLIYDRYDIWEIDPTSKADAVRVTKDGREKRLVYRYIKLDNEERFIKRGQKLMLSGFYEENKREAVFSLKYGQNKPQELLSGDYQYGRFKKARDNDQLIFTQESFQTFPDLHATDISFKEVSRVSNINPQQSEYNWGTIELVNWTSLEGEVLEGMLVKPEDFDPTRKYPLLVNFYEKSSNSLHRHRAPFPHRSTINYSFYASRGYVIFNPNVHYGTGYPGEDAYNCVIPGITMLLEKGFIDRDNIGVQGHSWGGYQIAHLLGETDIFKCAESGAPVVNMISAYGGIRWGSGLSRMFQYERTQSRIGGNLWEYPLRYIENSPIFTVDKVNTPVLIMHNDEDGAVPWYQGIEYFVALRRLGKPAWLLNYRGEPHWPLKIQNRIDFNVRMSQFFDHYLKGEPKPLWMRDGVPAMELGIKQGYELLEKE